MVGVSSLVLSILHAHSIFTVLKSKALGDQRNQIYHAIC